MPSKRPPWSLGRRLLLIAVGVMTTAILAGGVAMLVATKVEDNQMVDARLMRIGGIVLSFAETEIGEEADGSYDRRVPIKVRGEDTTGTHFSYQVWSRAGQALLLNHEAPTTKPLMPLDRTGFDHVKIGGEMYRTYAAFSRDASVQVQVAESIQDQRQRLALVALNYMGILVLPFAAMCFVTWKLLRRAMSSVNSIALQLTQRNPLDASRLEVGAPPKEMLPILDSLNALCERAGRALSAEHSFTSVAAHEMKTPLTGLRAQAELARMAQTPEEVKEVARAVVDGVDRATHMVDQLLDIARLETFESGAAADAREFDLRQVFLRVFDERQYHADAKNILVTSMFEIYRFVGREFGLTLALRNLLANAILYCPLHGRVHVSSAVHSDRIVVDVDDSGPGIAAEYREQAFERFNRLGQTNTRGVGLGLSIVLRVVELHDATIHLSDSPVLGGLRVRMSFPRANCDAALRSRS